MTHFEIVKKLIGEINPIGESNTDKERFDNLKSFCELVNELVQEIDSVGYSNITSKLYSKRKAGEYAQSF